MFSIPDVVQKLYDAKSKQTVFYEQNAYSHDVGEQFVLNYELSNKVKEATANGNTSKLEGLKS